MTATICSCGRPVADTAYLCQACTGRLARDLGDIGALADEVQTTRLRLARTGGAATGVLSRAYERPLPWNEAASDAADVLRSTVVAWVRVVLDDRGGRLPADTMQALSGFLLSNLEWLRHQSSADECADEIGHAVQVARRVIDLAPERTYAGPCREEFDQGDGDACCVAELYARRGSHVIVCRNCGAEHTVAARHRWLLEIANDRLVSAADLSRFLTAYGEPLTAERIRQWASRGLLEAKGKDRAGRPLYRVSEAADVLAALKSKRSAA